MTSPTEAPAAVAALTGIHGGRSRLNDFEQHAALAGLGWLGVAIAGVREIAGGPWPDGVGSAIGLAVLARSARG